MARNGLILVKEHFFSEFYWSLRRIAWHLFIKPLFIILYEKDKGKISELNSRFSLVRSATQFLIVKNF